MTDQIDIRPLKEIAKKMKEPVKSQVLSENDFVSKEEYFILSTRWFRSLGSKTE